MVGESISAAFFFWLGKARMIKKPIRGLGLDVDIYSIDREKGRSYGKVGTFFCLLFFSFRFSSVDGATAGSVFTIYFLLRIMYIPRSTCK